MADAKTSTVIGGGTVQGVVGARTVNIENFTFYAAAQLPAEPPRETEDAVPILPCPYPGLAYFSPQDSGLCFGRERAIARLAEAGRSTEPDRTGWRFRQRQVLGRSCRLGAPPQRARKLALHTFPNRRRARQQPLPVLSARSRTAVQRQLQPNASIR